MEGDGGGGVEGAGFKLVGGDGGGSGFDGEIGVEESLVGCEGPIVVTRTLVSAEMFVSARAGVAR